MLIFGPYAYKSENLLQLQMSEDTHQLYCFRIKAGTMVRGLMSVQIFDAMALLQLWLQARQAPRLTPKTQTDTDNSDG